MSDDASETVGTPALPHLSTEFFIWLWYASEREGGSMLVSERLGVIDIWVEDRLSFRGLEAEKTGAVVTGENASSSLEARAALASGKVVRDIQLHLRREEREYTVTLRGVHLDLAGLKMPATAGADGGEESLFYERISLYEEIWFLVEALYRRFARERTHADWPKVLAAMRDWVAGAPADAFPAPAVEGDEAPPPAPAAADEDAVAPASESAGAPAGS